MVEGEQNDFFQENDFFRKKATEEPGPNVKNA